MMFVEKSSKSIKNKLKASSISKLDNNAHILVLSHPWRQSPAHLICGVSPLSMVKL